MCPTRASGSSDRMPSVIAMPARRMGTSVIGRASTNPCVRSSGELMSISRTGKCRVGAEDHETRDLVEQSAEVGMRCRGLPDAGELLADQRMIEDAQIGQLFVRTRHDAGQCTGPAGGECAGIPAASKRRDARVRARNERGEGNGRTRSPPLVSRRAGRPARGGGG
jgi:hypothetical protein